MYAFSIPDFQYWQKKEEQKNTDKIFPSQKLNSVRDPEPLSGPRSLTFRGIPSPTRINTVGSNVARNSSSVIRPFFHKRSIYSSQISSVSWERGEEGEEGGQGERRRTGGREGNRRGREEEEGGGRGRKKMGMGGRGGGKEEKKERGLG